MEHLVGIGDNADMFALIPQVVEGKFKVRPLDLDVWMWTRGPTCQKPQ